MCRDALLARGVDPPVVEELAELLGVVLGKPRGRAACNL